MVGTRSPATLEIQLLADVARLKKDMSDAQRTIRSMTDDAGRSAGRMGQSFQQAGQSITTAFRSIAAVVATLGIGAAAREFLALTDESKKMAAQLKLATAEVGNFGKAQADVRAIAAGTRSDLAATASLYASFSRAAKELGINQGQVADITKSVNQAFKISGASTTDASNAIRQLSQAFASGVLRGDEFNSMMENAPRLSKLLADSLGVTVGSLRAMAEEGKLTADKLVQALSDRKFTAALDEEFRQMPVTFDEAMGQVHNAAVIAFGAFDRGGQFSTILANFVTDGAKGFADLERAAENFGSTLSAELAGVIGVANSFIGQLQTINSLMGGLPGAFLSRGAQDASIFDYLNPVGMLKRTVLDHPSFAAARDAQASKLALDKVMRGDPLADVGRGATVAAARATDAHTESKKKGAAASKKLTEAEKEAAKALREQEQAFKSAMGEAIRFAESLEEQASKFGKTAIEIHRMEVASHAAAVEAAGLAKGTKEAADAAAAAAKRIREVGSVVEGQMIEKANADFKEMIRNLENENKILGLVGPAREMAALALEEQAFRARAAKDGIQDVDAAWQKYLQTRTDGINKKTAIDADIEKTRQLAEQVDALTGAFANLRGLGGQAGRLIGALSSDNPTAALLGMGGIGTLVGLATPGGRSALEEQRLAVEQGLTAVFGEKAQGFAKTLSSVLQGATLGTFGANLVFGANGTNIGSAFGGAVGDAFKKDITKAVSGGAEKGFASVAGKLAGAFAPVIGGILGNLVGTMFTSTPKGRATFSGGSFTTSGNSQSRIGQASTLAGGVMDALNQIADAFGADVGSFSGTIGVRGKNIRYNPSGTSLKQGLNFGQDSEAALKAAIQDAISDGVFSGLTAGIERLLKGEGDLEKQLQKALSLQGAFDELKSIKDPQGFELGNLDKQFAKLRTIAEEAGEGLAQIEELYGLKRAEIVEKYATQINEAEQLAADNRRLEIEIMALSGDTLGALTAARALEQEGLDASTVALMQQRDALIDKAQREAEAAAVEQERIGLQIQLYEALGMEREAEALRLEQTRAAINPLNQALFDTVQAAQKAGSAMQAMSGAVGLLSGGGGGGNLSSALSNPLLGEGLRFVLGGGSAAQGAAIVRNTVAGTAATTFPNDAAAQAKYIADFEAGVAAGQAKGQGTPRVRPEGKDSSWVMSFGGGADSYSMYLEMKAAREAEAEAKKAEAEAKRSEALEKEASLLEDIVKQFQDIAQSLKDYRDELTGALRGPEATFRKLQMDLIKAGASRDPEELSKIPGMGRDFLEMALNRSSTEAQFRKQQAFVLGITNQGIGTAETVVDRGEAQLDALNRQLDKTDETNDRLAAIEKLLAEGNDERKTFRDEQRQLGLGIEKHTYNSDRTLKNVSRGGTSVEVEMIF